MMGFSIPKSYKLDDSDTTKKPGNKLTAYFPVISGDNRI